MRKNTHTELLKVMGQIQTRTGIMLTQLYSEYEFQPEDEVKISKKKDNSFELTVNPSGSM